MSSQRVNTATGIPGVYMINTSHVTNSYVHEHKCMSHPPSLVRDVYLFHSNFWILYDCGFHMLK